MPRSTAPRRLRRLPRRFGSPTPRSGAGRCSFSAAWCCSSSASSFRGGRYGARHALPTSGRAAAVSDDGFAAALATVLAHEGGYQAMPDDPGNWTGGKIGAGELKGTKFGLSAAAYPNLDIASLTEAEAAAIYCRDWWERFGL